MTTGNQKCQRWAWRVWGVHLHAETSSSHIRKLIDQRGKGRCNCFYRKNDKLSMFFRGFILALLGHLWA